MSNERYDFRVSSYATTNTPGVYIRHLDACPASRNRSARCRCTPSYRARRRDVGWSETFKTKEQALEWKSSAAARAEAEKRRAGITFGELAREWWAGIESGSVGKRKGRKGDGYSVTTLQGYERTLFKTLLPAFENEDAGRLDERRWQSWVDEQSKKGLSRSRIANQLAVVSAIYGWGSRSTRRLVPSNPTRAVELPPNDERPRERVATAEEAAELLAVLPKDIRAPYALAFYAGLRRSEIHRLEWGDVDLATLVIVVRRSKSDAGTGRRVPIAAPLVPILKAVQRDSGKVCERSVMSGKHAARARKAWKYVDHDKNEPKKERKPPLEPIGLHECRHTYASLLVAAHYTLKEVMDYLGHADLATTSRYVKMLPQPAETNPASRLNAYLHAE